MLRLIEIAPLSKRALNSLRRTLDEKCNSGQDSIIPEALAPKEFDHLRPGRHYGAFNEVILRREMRRDGVPKWFNPIETPGQFGIINPNGLRCYIEVDIDVARRNEPTTFQTHILPLVDEIPEQTSLF